PALGKVEAMQAPSAERPPGLPRVFAELRDELVRRPSLPPGETSFSLRRTHRFQRHTLRTLLAYHERYGPVFTVRIFHRPTVVMLGPEANHFVTVSGAENFSWRRGMFGEQLIPLLGDGLITTDDGYHDRARRIMMPAFHRRRMDAAVAVMVEQALRSLEPWRAGDLVDVYAWIRDLAMSIAMRALVGLDPSDAARGHHAAEWFERALSFYDTEVPLMMLRGPGSPWSRMQAARRELDGIVYAEIERRRREAGTGEDILSMLLDARDEDGTGLTDLELRHQVMTLLFGGHDTSSSTFSFLVYELARNPEVLARVVAEQDRVLAGRAPTGDQLTGELPELDMALDETLRLYPPVWFGPRMAVKEFEFGGHRIPAGTHVIHSSWVSHRLPEVFPDPDAFIPERFAPEARRELPKGAYIPFGGGQRICIGKRFGQLVVKAVATVVLQRLGLALQPGHELRIDKLPTLSPRGGLPMVVAQRRATASYEGIT
ncbi:MAG TPA: cytochrome P450, partial [Solirubrobacteraceae bacterium]|nr:cytochrome P450 [Solirubrobacteraceae bacterium]